jgi:hypothetical protein
VLLLMLVLSPPEHVERRMAIRDTWGASQASGAHRMPLVFVVGRTGRPAAQIDIASEHEIYADVVQADLDDSTANATRKTVAALQWASTYCAHAHFVLLASDDVLVDTFKLAAFLRLQLQQQPKQQLN